MVAGTVGFTLRVTISPYAEREVYDSETGSTTARFRA
jgi:hypothetical protein